MPGTQDQPYGSVTIVSGAATFSDSQSGILANLREIHIQNQGRRVVTNLAANGLTCTIADATNVTNAGFDYTGRQSAPVSS